MRRASRVARALLAAVMVAQAGAAVGCRAVQPSGPPAYGPAPVPTQHPSPAPAGHA